MKTPNRSIEALVQKVLAGASLDLADALFLIQIEGPDRYDLFHGANRIRRHFLGEQVHLCSIASAQTGGCSEDCRFCAQSSFYQTPVASQKATPEQLIDAAQRAAHAGSHCFGFVSSGYGPTNADIDRLTPVFEQIASEGQIRPAASLGCLTDDQAQRLYQAGVQCYHHNLETSQHFFPQVVTTHSYQARIATIHAARKAGMQVCSGGIFGLGETPEDRVDMAMLLRELNVDNVPLNFLQAVPGTPFAHLSSLPPLEALQAVAVYRFILPDKHIHIAGGRDQVLRDMQSWIFYAGASGCMVGNYLTTCGRPLQQDLQMLKDLQVAMTRRYNT